MKRYIIYIPGLGDNYDGMRQVALHGWRLLGVRTELIPMKWYDGASYEDKYERASAAIRRAVSRGYSVSLVGESAGGSMALNLAADHPGVMNVLTIAGVTHPSIRGSATTLRRSPAFAVSIKQLARSLTKLDTARIITLRGIKDSVVNERYSGVTGAKGYVVPMVGHLATITFCLTLWSYVVVRIIKTHS